MAQGFSGGSKAGYWGSIEVKEMGFAMKIDELLGFRRVYSEMSSFETFSCASVCRYLAQRLQPPAWCGGRHLSGRLVLAAVFLFCPLPSLAASGCSSVVCRADQITFYHGQGTDSNLTELPEQILTGDIPWESSYFEGIGYTHYFATPALLDSALNVVSIDHASNALELVVVKHRGRQHNTEVDLAYVLRTRNYYLGPVLVRFGAGMGVSYSFGRPSYEDGPSLDPDRRFKFQSYDAFELEMAMTSIPKYRLVGRLHHRSGMYGLIAPRLVGSNFLALGVRFEF